MFRKLTFFRSVCNLKIQKSVIMSSFPTWKEIPCSQNELKLGLTLVCGQAFRWKETAPEEWTGVLAGQVWTLSQTQESLRYRIHSDVTKTQQYSEDSAIDKKTVDKCQASGDTGKKSDNHTDACDHRFSQNPQVKDLAENGDVQAESILQDYFQLDVDLTNLYSQWSKADENFRSKALDFTGIRILKQDPVENLFSFICSSNNNITRISLMVDRMCQKFGQKICEVDSVPYYDFPSVTALAEPSVEGILRDLGFGYRAKYIAQTARYISDNHSTEWLYRLRDKSHAEAKAELMKLSGVGAKVADCVCLMSLDKSHVTPVDTHVWQIATRDYNLPGVCANKTLTDKVYNEIGDFFRNLWGDYAGWAQSVLFSADLKKFQDKHTNSKPMKRQQKSAMKAQLKSDTTETPKKTKKKRIS